jgi:rubrerythrin
MEDDRKQVLVYEEFDGADDNGKPIERVTYTCPKCNFNFLPVWTDECPECKQKLKW